MFLFPYYIFGLYFPKKVKSEPLVKQKKITYFCVVKMFQLLVTPFVIKLDNRVTIFAKIIWVFSWNFGSKNFKNIVP